VSSRSRIRPSEPDRGARSGAWTDDGTPIGDDGDGDFGRAGESAELRRDVLERLARHEITADEAAVLLRARKE